jgi:hypothetical protein
MGSTCSLGLTSLLSFLKLHFLNVSLQSFSFFLISSKVLSKSKKIYEKKKKNKLEKKNVDLILETSIVEAKCLQIFVVFLISLTPLSTSVISL